MYMDYSGENLAVIKIAHSIIILTHQHVCTYNSNRTHNTPYINSDAYEKD